ncbi:response regulator transcription factor [Marinobacter sp. 1_MG-2023]|uniref:response regulator transcription factor n=1 Tax=Marinobacter sp. 1_MG-2023 TaxID=3062627 RepID=UPI0026E3B9BA|nr:response regulator [Marinobacter sp. 1_MG-2023]MDO6825465.1 LuxR C-terminal-related transcriptional regulator [Marinobacter sp. 1_MG-2023]
MVAERMSALEATAAQIAAEGITIYIVDDDAAFGKSLKRLVCAEGYRAEVFASGAEFLSRSITGPGCILLDFRMSGMSGIELQTRILQAGISLPVIFLSGEADIPVSVNAMKQGAIDFLIKPIDHIELFRAIELGLERFKSIEAANRYKASILDRLGRLSAREREVLEEVVKGRLNKQIGYDLGIAEKTVKVHRSRVMEKMEVRSLAELVHLCHDVNIGINPVSD